MMRRRAWLTVALAGPVLGGLSPAAAQPAGKVIKLGWLRPNAAGSAKFQPVGIPGALQRLGWVEGQNLIIERSWAGGQVARLPELARELVQQRCDVLLRKPIIELALRYKLPTMWDWPEQVRDGGLMAYGTSLAVLHDRIAHYLDRVFNGARPGELPIEQPTTFGLVLNQGTARAIGLPLPRALLLRADEVIE